MYICNMFFILFLIISLSMYLLGLLMLEFNMNIMFEYSFFYLNSSSMKMFLFVDWISMLFMSFVLLISSLIIKYSSEYMMYEKNLKRFIYLMILFVISMMMMIISPNLITILIGWDGLGLVSYALVIYYQNIKSFNAGMLTALSNRVGDAALLMCISIMMSLGEWNLYNFKDFLTNELAFYFSFFIILASITKSAQIPFSSWLPAAMAAPTPVSSLVHSSTLVTAGVYLLIRFSSFFSSSVLELLMFISLLTMFMAGLGANFEYDLKKIIALSTLSQLGMMIFILSLGGLDLAFFHLLIHALFKALLFMCAGAMIHNLNDCQDIRFMGSLIYFSPLTCTCFNISNMALCGVPFLSGFYSKDLIAEISSLKLLSIFIYMFFYISIGLTVSYSIRLSYYIFMGSYNFYSINNYSDSNNYIMLKGMMGLVFFVIFMGSLMSWILFPVPYFIILPVYMKLLTLLMIVMGGIMGKVMGSLWYGILLNHYNFLKKVWFTAMMWNLPILSTFGLNFLFLNLGKSYYKNIDIGWLEYYGSKNLFFSLKNLSQFSQLFSKNHLKLFLFTFLAFIMLFYFV
uniref:NADH-ubiquinone oxidoreductase chain 5 n=1 Tax=Ceutorhynchus obstrictus TaxID=307131 RepID=A0A5J6KE59_9CUCU|nr:NADH dehydrogenase subunit 5 [Ceutorhynchus obstrictus]QEV84343.1 NADH dehydrogenase subunit 5 [Ceutorhynchus obstrictus]